jgi:hypothetical protein
LLICASSAPNNAFWQDREEMRLLHAGCMIGVVEVVDCRPMTRADDGASMGNYVASSFAWVMKPVGFCRPTPIVSRLRLFDVPAEGVVMLDTDIDKEWLFDYPLPQGEVKYTARCPVIS